MNKIVRATFLVALMQFHQAAFCQVNSSLDSEMFSRQFDWAMYIDVKDLPDYLNYKGTKLYPITKARTFVRTFPRDTTPFTQENSEVFEEFWYHKSTPLGSRRRLALKLARGSAGAIAMGKLDAGRHHPEAAANVAVRTFVDLLLKGVDAQVLLIPADEYELVSGKLADYGFSSKRLPTSGRQISIILRSYPAGKDEQVFLAQR